MLKGAAGGATMTLDLPATIQTASSYQIDPDDAYAGWQFQTNGKIRICEGTSVSWSNDHDWGTPSTSEGEYWEIRATLNSGSLYTAQSDATGVWLDLDTNPQWVKRDTISAGPAVTASLTIEIREKADTGNNDSQTYKITVEVEA